MNSNLSAFPFIAERSEATPELWNRVYSILSANIAAVDSNATINLSGATLSIGSSVSIGRDLWVQGSVTVGVQPSAATRTAVNIGVRSDTSDYLYFTDEAALRSNYIIGSHVGGTADGLNIWDASGLTMIASFSKQSIRFYQNVVGPVFDVGGALADTLNAATFGTGADSIETRIQAAISAASAAGIARVYLPANMYPYSAASISFDTRVQMVREGGDWSVFDVIAYGANGNGSIASAAANSAAIQSAISGANADPLGQGITGGLVFIPAGQYAFDKTIRLPVALNQGQVILRGAGMRVSNLYPLTSTKTAILFGSATPDPSGTFTFQTQYMGLEDLHIVGSNLTDAAVGVQMTEVQKGWMRNVIVESFQSPGAIGLYLRGATGAAGPHLWRCGFFNVVVATTYRPILIENGDENDFYNCNFAPPTGLTSAVSAFQIIQGRNNRIFGGLLAGESSSVTTGRPAYTGLLLSTPSVGQVAGTQVYGLVCEGFDSGISIAASVNNTAILFYNSSINSRNLADAGTNTLYFETGDLGAPFYQHPAGTVGAPAFAFLSEGSLGWYRSRNSYMALSRGVLEIPGAPFSATTPTLTFASNRSTGLIDNTGPGLDVVVTGTVAGRALASQWLTGGTGATNLPGFGFGSERSLGFYRSGVSRLGLSYGQFTVPDGSNTTPSIGLSSATSIGFYSSGVQTITQSLGTFNLATNAVRLSMRTLAASSVTASAVNTNVARDEVVFTIGGASGASLIISSGGTAYIFNSAASAILA